jgi:hypothetical protein
MQARPAWFACWMSCCRRCCSSLAVQHCGLEVFVNCLIVPGGGALCHVSGWGLAAAAWLPCEDLVLSLAWQALMMYLKCVLEGLQGCLDPRCSGQGMWVWHVGG